MAAAGAAAGAAEREVVRVAAHIAGAEQIARSSPPARLDRLRHIVRSLLLEELEAYRREGVFPKNRDFDDRAMPYFVDADGTRCAMAHLLETGGAIALVARIAKERNNAFVRELADEPELLAWLDAAGLTVDEAARIQPSYCGPNSAKVCGGTFSGVDFPTSNAKGVLEIKITEAASGTQPYAKGRVEAVFGDGGRFTVGAEVRQKGGYTVGATFLVPIHDDGSDAGVDASATDGGEELPIVGSGLSLGADGIVSGGQMGNNAGHPLTKAQVAAAYQSADCAAHLTALDAYWGQSSCSGPGSGPDQNGTSSSGGSGGSSGSGTTAGENASGDGGGCSTSGAADGWAPTVAILIAVVAAVSARRLARAARQG